MSKLILVTIIIIKYVLLVCYLQTRGVRAPTLHTASLAMAIVGQD